MEVDVAFSFPSSLKVDVLFEDGNNYVTVDKTYQSKPPVCAIFKVFGHSMAKCLRTVQQWVPKEVPSKPSSALAWKDWTLVNRDEKKDFSSAQANSSNSLKPSSAPSSTNIIVDPHILGLILSTITTSRGSLEMVSASLNSSSSLDDEVEDPNYESPVQVDALVKSLKHVEELSSMVFKKNMHQTQGNE